MEERSRKHQFIEPVIEKLEVVDEGAEIGKVFHSFEVRERKEE